MDQRECQQLAEIELIEDQTDIVDKAIAEGLDRVYYAPDPDSPKEGSLVQIPKIIQMTYRCMESECSYMIVRRFLRADVLKGHFAKRLRCSACYGWTRVKTKGAERDIPVVDRGDSKNRRKQGLERWV